MSAMTDAFGRSLVDAGSNQSVVLLNADLGNSTRSSYFTAKYPERSFNFGIAEQDEISTAAGLALGGKIPVAATYSIFATRAWEQIRNTIARANLNVKIVGTHAGLTDFGDGSSHQALEDIAIFRALPNFTVICPSDAYQTSKLMSLLIERKGPTYMRLARGDVADVYSTEDFEIGKPFVVEDGDDVTIFACGLMVSYAIEACRMLKKDGIDAGVIDLHTIKPLDEKSIEKLARKTGCFVTAEEHNIVGGMGSAISEVTSRRHPVPIEMVGVRDQFGNSASLEELFEHFGLTSKNIIQSAKKSIERRL